MPRQTLEIRLTSSQPDANCSVASATQDAAKTGWGKKDAIRNQDLVGHVKHTHTGERERERGRERQTGRERQGEKHRIQYNIVADRWTGASNPHPHPNPHTQASRPLFFPLRWTDGPTDRWLD